MSGLFTFLLLPSSFAGRLKPDLLLTAWVKSSLEIRIAIPVLAASPTSEFFSVHRVFILHNMIPRAATYACDANRRA